MASSYRNYYDDARPSGGRDYAAYGRFPSRSREPDIDQPSRPSADNYYYDSPRVTPPRNPYHPGWNVEGYSRRQPYVRAEPVRFYRPGGDSGSDGSGGSYDDPDRRYGRRVDNWRDDMGRARPAPIQRRGSSWEPGRRHQATPLPRGRSRQGRDDVGVDGAGGRGGIGRNQDRVAPARRRHQSEHGRPREHADENDSGSDQHHSAYSAALKHIQWKSALTAGTVAALVASSEPGSWSEKGVKVATAGLSAIFVDSFMHKRYPDKMGGICHQTAKRGMGSVLTDAAMVAMRHR